MQRKFEIGQGMDATLWRFLRLRPENFPHIRLAQLAYLYQKGDKLFSRLLEAETLADVRTLLDARTSPYWENHYLFGRPSSQKEKTMGERSKDLIIINTVVPFSETFLPTIPPNHRKKPLSETNHSGAYPSHETVIIPPTFQKHLHSNRNRNYGQG